MAKRSGTRANLGPPPKAPARPVSRTKASNELQRLLKSFRHYVPPALLK
ncbi:MAG TPA: hypothetical protein VN519_07295 [Bryobacteraceae bacterium]|nr:hypothetical protein [Bryobacteraceae bacterium]